MKLINLAILAVLLASCSKKQPEIDGNPVFDDPNWIRLEISKGKEAHAIFGNLDDTLVVSTLTSVYQTIDKGKTWKEIKANNQPVYGFFAKQDTVFALMANSLKNQANQTLATFSQLRTKKHNCGH